MEFNNENDLWKKLKDLENKMIILEEKLDKISSLLEGDIGKNCQKMNQHIHFVERIYDNVKRPLGYLCNKINFFSKDRNYSLENKDYSLEDKNNI